MDAASPFAQQQMAGDLLTNIGPNGVNQLATLGCNDCGHEWIAPTIGACPKCHRSNTIQTEFRSNALPRV